MSLSLFLLDVRVATWAVRTDSVLAFTILF